MEFSAEDPNIYRIVESNPIVYADPAGEHKVTMHPQNQPETFKRCSGHGPRRTIRWSVDPTPVSSGWIIQLACVRCAKQNCPCNYATRWGLWKERGGYSFGWYCDIEAWRVVNGAIQGPLNDDTFGMSGSLIATQDGTCGEMEMKGQSLFVTDSKIKKLFAKKQRMSDVFVDAMPVGSVTIENPCGQFNVGGTHVVRGLTWQDIKSTTNEISERSMHKAWECCCSKNDWEFWKEGEVDGSNKGQ